MKTIIEMGEAWAKAMASFFSGVNAALAQRNKEVYEKASNMAIASRDDMDAILCAAAKRAEESAETVSEALDRLAEEAGRAHDCAVCFKTLHRRSTNNWRKMHGLPMRRKMRSGKKWILKNRP